MFAGKETAQQGADNVAAAWEKLTDKLGRENQVKYYRISMGSDLRARRLETTRPRASCRRGRPAVEARLRRSSTWRRRRTSASVSERQT